MRNLEKVLARFQAYRKNPTETRLAALVACILTQSDSSEKRKALALASKLSGMPARGSVSQVHRELVTAANAAGIDPVALAGGQTPED